MGQHQATVEHHLETLIREIPVDASIAGLIRPPSRPDATSTPSRFKGIAMQRRPCRSHRLQRMSIIATSRAAMSPSGM